MSNYKRDVNERDLDEQLRLILAVFGRKQESGEPPLESLPPSLRLEVNAPLNAWERSVIGWADFQFYKIMSVAKDKQVTGQPVDLTKHSELGEQGPPKTLTDLLKEQGIPDAPAHDPIYQSRYIIKIGLPPKPSSPSAKGSSSIKSQFGAPQHKLIDKSSRQPEDHQKFLFWLRAMATAFRAPKTVVLLRIREVCRSALLNGVNWRDLYEMVKSAQPEKYLQFPVAELVDPER
jgi:hypothetical protein